MSDRLLKKQFRITPVFVFKIGICLLPLILIAAYLVLTRNAAFMANMTRAATKIQPKLILNFLLVTAASVMMLLAGFRIHLFLCRLFKVNLAQHGPLAVFFASFLFGSFFTYIILMTVGVLGLYFTPVVWGAVLLVVLFPVGLKEAFQEARKTIAAITPTRDLGFVLFVSAFVYFSIATLLTQFTSVFPPCMDVMEVYVAPAERVLVFHRFMPENSMPCAYYNEFRSVPLHTALYAFLAILTGLTSYEAVTASFILLLVVFLASSYFLARTFGGRLAGGIAAWLFVGIVHYEYIIGARSGIFCMLYFFPGFVFFVKMMLSQNIREKFLFAVLAGLAFGSVTLMHTVVGVYVLFSVSLVLVFSKLWISWSAFWEGAVALVVAAMVSSLFLFQLETPLGIGMPFITLLVFGLCAISCGAIWLIRTKLMREPAATWSAFTGIRRFVPIALFIAVILVIAIVPWKSMWHNEPPFMILIRLSPILFVLGLIAIIRIGCVFVFNRNLSPSHRLKLGVIVLFGACTLFSFASSMYVFPFFKFTGVMEMSFSFEIPGKGVDFFITPFLTVAAALIVTMTRRRIVRYALVSLIVASMTLPTQVYLNKIWNGFTETAPRSLVAAADEELNWAAYGYFGGWDGDDRIPLSQTNFILIDHLKDLIARGEITMNDTIFHASREMHPWIAIPFPVFTGIRQTLVLVDYDPYGIFTGFGRLYSFPGYIDFNNPPRWVLIEKSLDYRSYTEFHAFMKDRYVTDFESDRNILYRLR